MMLLSNVALKSSTSTNTRSNHSPFLWINVHIWVAHNCNPQTVKYTQVTLLRHNLSNTDISDCPKTNFLSLT